MPLTKPRAAELPGDSVTPKVLVATEDPALRALLADALQDTGYFVVDARDAAELFARLDLPGSIVLTIVDTAALDQASARRIAALRARDSSVPLVLLAAMADVDRDALEALRPSGVLAKPFGLQQLRQLIARLLAPS